MPNKIPSKRAERTLSKSGFVWPKSIVARPMVWRKVAHTGSWNNLVWKWTTLGISSSGCNAAERLELFPSEVFAHPDLIAAHRGMSDYYRLMAFLPKKGLPKITTRAGSKEIVLFCKLVNQRLSFLVAAAARASRRNRFNPIIAGAGSNQHNWEDHWRFPWLKHVIT